MSDLIFPGHASDQMANDSISEAEVYHVVEDADDILEREDGRTDYRRLLDDGRSMLVVVENEGITVVRVWWDKRRSRRRRR